MDKFMFGVKTLMCLCSFSL